MLVTEFAAIAFGIAPPVLTGGAAGIRPVDHAHVVDAIGDINLY
ncbi:MAG: hypothetical protein WA869_23255 [Alloacidobacterium sp.]